MKRNLQVKVKKGEIILPVGFSSGFLERFKEEGCLFVIPQGWGRKLNLPKEEREFAGIGNEVQIVNCGDYFEIWNPQRFEDFIKKEEELYEEIAERLDIEL